MGPDFQLLTNLAGTNTFLDLFGIFCAQYLPYLMVLFFLALVLVQKPVKRKLQLIFFSGMSLIVSYGVIGKILEYALYRPRPFVQFDFTPLVAHAADTSFPSSHMIILFTLATIIFSSVSRQQGTWLYILATLVGLARIFVGLHFPLDIAAGALIGFAAPLLVRLLVSEIRLSPTPKTESQGL